MAASLKRQKIEQGQMISEAKKKFNVMEKELQLTATQTEKFGSENLREENEKLKKMVAELTSNLRALEKKVFDSTNLEKAHAKLKKDEYEARNAAAAYKKELDLAEQELKNMRKNALDSPNHRRHKLEEIHALEHKVGELEDQLERMQVKLVGEQKEKSEAFRMISLFRNELDQQEDFFKKELSKYGELARFAKETNQSELGGAHIDEIIKRFTMLQNALKNERFYSEKRSLEEKQIALKVTD